jgi:CubicO group peptidase (beta-lactamase class C family)
LGSTAIPGSSYAIPDPTTGVSPTRLARALSRLDAWVAEDRSPGVAAVVVRRGEVVGRHFVGTADPGGESARDVSARTVFPLGSIAKPVTAVVFMRLVETGEVLLDDPVARFVPEFGRAGKESIRVRHLLSHTSGLPDSLPNNESLRKRREALPSFVRSACRLEPSFVPGTRVLYSNPGILVLAEVVERVYGQPFAEVAEQTVFRPFGLSCTSYRPPPDSYPEIARLRLPRGRKPTSWDSNSAYWRQLGSAWGGLFSTADDLARFGQLFLDALDGRTGGNAEPLVSPAAARAMTHRQTEGIETASGDPEAWGFGWALPGHHAANWVGDLASPSTFGHIGGSGTLWVDPAAELVCVILTSDTIDWTAEYRRFAAFGNALLGAVVS